MVEVRLLLREGGRGQVSKWITLRLEVAEGVSADDVVDYLNADSLCAMEEDKGLITSWEWSELGGDDV